MKLFSTFSILSQRLEQVNESAAHLLRLKFLPRNKLINALNASQTDTMRAFSHPDIISKLMLGEIFEVIAPHRRLVDKIWANQDLMAKLTRKGSRHLAVVSQHFSDLAYRILNMPEFKNDENVLVILGCRHIEIAHYILNTPELASKLCDIHLAKLGQYIPEIANRILDTPELAELLSGSSLAMLGQASVEVAQRILNSDFVDELDGLDLSALGETDSSIASAILDNPELLNKLLDDNEYGSLGILGMNFPEIVERILNMPEFIHKFISENDYGMGISMAILGQHYPAIAYRILQTPSFINRLTGDDLVEHLASTLPEIAFYILNSPTLIDKLKGNSFASHLSYLGKAHPIIAHHILNTPSMVDVLDGNNLTTLGHDAEIAYRIFDTPKLVAKLNGHHLIHLAQFNPEISTRILNTPELVDKLPKDDILNCLFNTEQSLVINKVLDLFKNQNIEISKGKQAYLEHIAALYDGLLDLFKPTLRSNYQQDATDKEYGRTDSEQDPGKPHEPKRRRMGVS